MAAPGKILLPTAYFPPLSYFVILFQSKDICIEQMETFPKQTYRNRCEIMTASGKVNMVVPVIKPQGNHTITKNIEICYNEPWQQQHWKTLQAAYRSSPFFSYYADIIEPMFESREKNLLTQNQIILKTICGLFGVNQLVEFTNEYIKAQPGLMDLRTKFSPGSIIPSFEFSRYPQVFEYRHGFIPNLCILDLLFNLGPDAMGYLELYASHPPDHP